MSEAEEFHVSIDRDGRIRLDFRGMSETSYRRIVEVLRETVGPIEELEIEAGEDDPPGVHERLPEESAAEEKRELRRRG